MSDIHDARVWARRVLSQVESGGTLGTPAEANAAEVLLRITEPRPISELPAMPPLSGAETEDGQQAVILYWDPNDDDRYVTGLVKDHDGVWRHEPCLNPDMWLSNLTRYEIREV
ncbi:hypothetical protein [Corynebacterium lujinxingii]|uniref:Uncharacterized protein n=1 Tax=Corynebacterium lujinxingii TaxID=2763010 RepID=A0A7H0JWP8_9CORY|nr:hypothetical protein [Corynebacterium lujinxingii]MBC3178122.1 hypothetical protein [Corynebacterium lujinxingii]NNO09638.1 hypothetical protein [Corynebacterium lujinxingii]QNP89464.1 hypothetical protein IAU68_07060 [Corynebacterium lujinxingii]